jgi:beta-phosphoglucomutase
MTSNPECRAVLFDLDGVIVDTARFHYEAWKRVAEEEGICFDREINERLKGVSRMRSLEILLERSSRPYSDEQKEAMAARKNGYYLERVDTLTAADILPGVTGFLGELQAAGIRSAICSASRNTPRILECLGLLDWFNAVVDGNCARRSKPDPEVFTLAAAQLGLDPSVCLVIEDAYSGIEAAHAAGMRAIGLGRSEVLNNADLVAISMTEVSLDRVRQLFLECNSDERESDCVL